MEAYIWLIILATWSLLLLFGLAGGDPLAVGRPGHEAPAIRLAKRLRTLARSRSALATPRLDVPRPTRPSESGLHAIA